MRRSTLHSRDAYSRDRYFGALGSGRIQRANPREFSIRRGGRYRRLFAIRGSTPRSPQRRGVESEYRGIASSTATNRLERCAAASVPRTLARRHLRRACGACSRRRSAWGRRCSNLRRRARGAAVLVTKDEDFVDRVHHQGPPPQIVWVTCGNVRNGELREIVSRAWPRVVELLANGEPVADVRVLFSSQ